MTDTKELEIKIRASGLRKEFIAEKMELSRYTLLNKLQGKTEFKASEITKLAQLLNLSNEDRDRIFFGVKVE